MRQQAWIGIDPSYTAFAVVRVHADGTHHDQVLDFSPKVVGEGANRLDMIFRILSEKFETVHACFDVKAVAVEGYAMEAKFGREIAGELGGLTRVVLMRELRKAAIIVPPYSLKKFVTGNAKASKDDMRAGVLNKWGVAFTSHDRADAYGLAQIAKASTRGAALDYEKEVLEKLSTVKKRTTAA